MALPEINKLNRIPKFFRFFLGLAVFIWLFWLGPKSAGQNTISALVLYTIFPIAVFSFPAILIGLYFLITTRFRMRLDIIFLFLLIFLLSTLQRFIVPQQPPGDISGDTKFEVTLLKADGTPVTNVEVDIGEKPGTPPDGGRQLTNSKGVAIFSLKPGKYLIYFNDSSFPGNLTKPVEPPPINVVEGKLNTKTIILNFNKHL